jgi:hypothetical protein
VHAGTPGPGWGLAGAWLATASSRQYLFIRRHLVTGEMAFCYCYVPASQPASLSRLVRAVGCRWPVEEDFRSANASVAHCAFFSSGVLEESNLARFYLDT